jgi:hypothetical protein
MRPSALRFELSRLFIYFILPDLFAFCAYAYPGCAGRGGGGERGRAAQPGAASLLLWSARDLVRCTRAGYWDTWLPRI